MQKNNQAAIMIFVAVVLIAVAVLFYFYSLVPRYTWDENYDNKKEQPYAVSILYQLLQSSVKKDSFTVINKSIPKQLKTDSLKIKNACYFMIGEESHYDSADVANLKHFVEAGNDVFCINSGIDDVLKQNMKLMLTTHEYESNEEEEEENGAVVPATTESSTSSETDSTTTIVQTDSMIREKEIEDSIERNRMYDKQLIGSRNGQSIQLNFTDKTLTDLKGYTVNYFVDREFQTKWWSYFKTKNFNDTLYKVEVLGYFNDSLPCFIRIKYGKGYFYFHSIPLSFSNYHLLSERNYDYVNKCLSYISFNKIYWDEASKFYKNNDNEEENYKSQSPLSYILSQRSLRWAWYGMLGLLLLFVLFKMKRKQRIIPIILPKSNTFGEYIESIVNLYFKQKDHRNIGIKKWKLFLAFIRNRYNISTQQLDAHFILLLQTRATVDEKTIKELIVKNNILENTNENYTKEDLIDLHQLLQHFYKNCK